MMKFIWVLLACLSANNAIAQSPDGFMVREIAPCAVQFGNGAEVNGADPVQPCRSPGTNEFIARKFADGTYGVFTSYRDYSRAWARAFECEFVGRGVLSGSNLRITEALTDGKWKRCEIVVSGMPKPGQRIAKIDFEFAPGCQSERICSHDVEAVGGISGFVEKPFGPAFDCKRARSETEKTICLDWNLSELDFQLAILWSRWDIEALNPEQSAQVQWRRSRDACGANSVCIRSEYKKRMTALCAKRSGQLDKQFGCSK